MWVWELSWDNPLSFPPAAWAGLRVGQGMRSLDLSKALPDS